MSSYSSTEIWLKFALLALVTMFVTQINRNFVRPPDDFLLMNRIPYISADKKFDRTKNHIIQLY